MTTKVFVLLLVAVLVLGGSIGGAFAGGMALGKSQGRATVTSGGPQQAQGQLSQEQLQQLRQQAQGGQLTQEQLQQFGQGGLGGRLGFGGGGGLTGTVDKIEGDTVTVTTAQGPLQATLSADTTIQKTTVGTVADLTPGLRVTVVGQRGEDGTITARSILITP